MSDEQPKYNRLVNPGAPSNEPPAVEPTGEPETTNPWLIVMVGAGIMSFMVGMALYDNAYGGFENPAMQVLWGYTFIGLGVMLVVAAMASAAICWQLERNRRS